MAFDSLAEFWAMGNYGAYVWSAYGISFVTIAFITLLSVVKGRKVRAELRQRYLRD
ncbi:heme exporter protein CcmD [Marinomonas sp.]